ncbi:unnamed protein product [Schistosoma curassoni]|uniref:Reverse transcriptase domain-containing protein n=1 Tax=Schistosoma curassoni TaxID=6186 RepID=A0A183KKI4_9TREM|nr:unnamed protein product [Schistosoma curassoni]
MSTSEGKHGIQWTSRMQLDDLDFADDLALLSQTQQQMQEKTNSVAAASAAGGSGADVKARIGRARTVYLQLGNTGTQSNCQPTPRSGFSIQMSRQFYCMGRKPGEL